MITMIDGVEHVKVSVVISDNKQLDSFVKVIASTGGVFLGVDNASSGVLKDPHLTGYAYIPLHRLNEFWGKYDAVQM